MQFERTMKDIGGSLMIVIPADLVRWLELKKEDIVVIRDDVGKHGNFLSIWKKGE